MKKILILAALIIAVVYSVVFITADHGRASSRCYHNAATIVDKDEQRQELLTCGEMQKVEK